MEVYAVCGPLFDVGDDIHVIGENRVVVPHGFFKSVLAERKTGRFDMWSFMIPNEDQGDKSISSFRCTTEEVERRAGLSLWDRLRGEDGDDLRQKKQRMWSMGSKSSKKNNTKKKKTTKKSSKKTSKKKT